MPSHHRTSAEATRAQGGDEAVGRDKFIWVEQNGKLVMMKVEDETRQVPIKSVDLTS